MLRVLFAAASGAMSNLEVPADSGHSMERLSRRDGGACMEHDNVGGAAATGPMAVGLSSEKDQQPTAAAGAEDVGL